MLKKFFVVAAISCMSISALAVGEDEVTKTVELKGGSTVYIFKDGKMAMVNKYGHIVRMEPGQVMVAKDGQKIAMQGDEVARLDSILSVYGG